MDDQFAYILNALWTRHYNLGRILRFRHLTIGRQAQVYEILTAESYEYSVCLFPPQFSAEQLTLSAKILPKLYGEHFPVTPFIKSTDGHYVVGGPQSHHFLVSPHAQGQPLPAAHWSEKDLAHLGLRLGWLHRLTRAFPIPPNAVPLADRLLETLPANALQLNLQSLGSLHHLLRENPPALHYTHGDISPTSLLLDPDRQIKTIIDWALVHLGDPLEDVIDAFAHFCISPDGMIDPIRGRTLLEAYCTLQEIPADAWWPGILAWLAQRILDALPNRRPLPRGFATFLSNPKSLLDAIHLCKAK